MSITNYRMPGVYVTETDIFPPPMAGVQTAVPAFIGYTGKADVKGDSVLFKPVQVGSLADFETIFGTGHHPRYNLVEAKGDAPADLNFGKTAYRLVPHDGKRFIFHQCMRLYFDNGGGTCYIVSVGDYQSTVNKDDLLKGLKVIEDQTGPTILAAPEAVLLKDTSSFNAVVQAMLSQCAEKKDRFALLDIHAPLDPKQDDFGSKHNELIEAFRAGAVAGDLSYGASYFPHLNTTLLQPSDFNLTNFNFAQPFLSTFESALKEAVSSSYQPESPYITALTARINEIKSLAVLEQTALEQSDPEQTDTVRKLSQINQELVAGLPALKAAYQVMASQLNVLPPTPAIAGILAHNDSARSIWTAPANVELNSVVAPTVKVSRGAEENFAVPDDGKAVNLIKSFPGRGTMVWGARTLDGNNYKLRYIQVRRTIMYIEQSIAQVIKPFDSAANTEQTWKMVTSLISGFLKGVWREGGLVGASPDQAFAVQCGLATTMTPQDIMNGDMIVQVTVAMIHPAEFIELTFKRKMGRA
jgi:phage tail sheath protein FI